MALGALPGCQWLFRDGSSGQKLSENVTKCGESAREYREILYCCNNCFGGSTRVVLLWPDGSVQVGWRKQSLGTPSHCIFPKERKTKEAMPPTAARAWPDPAMLLFDVCSVLLL